MTHFAGRVADVGRLFTITRDQYLQWARRLPASAFVATEPSLRDDFYLLERSGRWCLVAQERGMENWKMEFDSKELALEHAIRHLSPYSVYEHLEPGSDA